MKLPPLPDRGVRCISDQIRERDRQIVELCAQVCEMHRDLALSVQSGDEHELGNVMLRQVAYAGAETCATAIRKLLEDK